MKTYVDWRHTLEKNGWTIRDGNGEVDAFIRLIQRDARESTFREALDICRAEQATFDLVVRDGESNGVSREDRIKALAAGNGIAVCLRKIECLKRGLTAEESLAHNEAPLGNNTAPEAKQ